MKGKNCRKALVKIIHGEECVLCTFSLVAFRKMQPCVGENCTLDDEIAEWEADEIDETN